MAKGVAVVLIMISVGFFVYMTQLAPYCDEGDNYLCRVRPLPEVDWDEHYSYGRCESRCITNFEGEVRLYIPTKCPWLGVCDEAECWCYSRIINETINLF